MRFRNALLVAMLPLVSLALLGTVAVVTSVLGRSARREVSLELARARRVVDEQMALRDDLFRAQARVMADEPRIKAVVATEDITHETVLGVASELRTALGSDLFLVTDGSGRLLADVASPTAQGFDLSSDPVVAQALARGEGAGLWSHGRHAYQVQARRLAFGATSVGLVIVGFEIDERVARAIESQTGCGVIIQLAGETLAAAPRELAPIPLATVDGGNVAVEVEGPGGARHLALGVPPRTGASSLRFVVTRSLDEALAPARRLARILWGVLFAALLATLALAVLLARRLARPLDELVGFTARIAAGDLAARAVAHGAVEVQALGEAMNQMVEELGRARQQAALRDRLEKEMEIAQRIQTSILPHDLRVDGLDVAAAMIPASEVGGDYYDVIPSPTGCWLGIGDVAGHGLTAGLVMMMIQSVVSALVRANPDALPGQLLQSLNGVLYDNIRRRLKQDEHVTLTLLRYDSDGNIVFAGAHEEIVVVRADGTVERIETPGPWMGGVRDVSAALVETRLQLRAGDVMLLYTDGVTEGMDAQHRCWDMDRLCEAARRHRALPVAELRDRILDEVRAWTVQQEDDVTLMVVRQRA